MKNIVSLRQVLKLVCFSAVIAIIVAAAVQGRNFLPGTAKTLIPIVTPDTYFTEEQAHRADAYTNFIYGLLYEHRGRFDKAAEKFAKVKEYDPESALARGGIRTHLRGFASQHVGLRLRPQPMRRTFRSEHIPPPPRQKRPLGRFCCNRWGWDSNPPARLCLAARGFAVAPATYAQDL